MSEKVLKMIFENDGLSSALNENKRERERINFRKLPGKIIGKK
jgi:hypothetical protein